MKQIERKRLTALLIDLIVISILSSLFKDVKMFEFALFGLKISSYLNVSFILMLLYFLFFSLMNNGVSFGKKLVKIKVIRSDLKTMPSVKNQIIRAILKTLAITLFVLTFIDYLVFNKMFYDRILKLEVVKK